MSVILQAFIVFVAFRLYPLLAVFFFGEGSHSYLCSSGNAVVWIIVSILGPTIFNLFCINRGMTEKIKEKARTYIIIELILPMLYAGFLLWWSLNAQFHI